MTAAGASGGATPEERLRETTQHLQAAAKELIAAARAVLDVAEDLVDDPGPWVAAVASLADLGRSVISGHVPADGQNDDPVRPGPRVEHIRVS